jgi:hypothetical protein
MIRQCNGHFNARLGERAAELPKTLARHEALRSGTMLVEPVA